MRYIAVILALMLLVGCTAPAVSDATPESSAPTTTATTVTTITTQKPTTAPTTAVKSDKEQVKTLLSSGQVATIYKQSYNSIFGRVKDNGFFQESLTGRYRGEYIRSIGALAILAIEVGETDKAGRALKFVTDTMQKQNLTMIPFTITADGNVNTADELDGRAHFVYGWAEYILNTKDTAYFDKAYALMKGETDAFCKEPCFYESWGLMRNLRFTHTRVTDGEDYHDDFDILTNAFVAAALDSMITLARQNGKETDAVLWETTLQKLKAGIAKNLTRQVDGKTVYLELRDWKDGHGVPEYGVSWVCIAPFGAGGAGLDTVVLQNTATLVRQKLWKEAGNGGYLAVECSASGKVQNWILGKSVGWDIAGAVESQNYAHIAANLRFLARYHTNSVYMEKMRPNGNAFRLEDCGNGEQVIWFLWGVAKARRAVGLNVKP